MKRTIIACLVLLGTACVQNANLSMVEIDGRAYPSDFTKCTFATGGQFWLGPGTLDLSYPGSSYRMVLYVKNNLADPTTLDPAALTGAKVWYPQAADVRIDPKSYTDAYGPNPALLSTTFSGNVTGLDGQGIQPAGGSGTVLVVAVSAPLAMQLGALVGPMDVKSLVLGVTLRGKTGDGSSLDSAEWYFPLQVCNGCLPLPTCTTAGQVPVDQSCFGPQQDALELCGTPPSPQ